MAGEKIVLAQLDLDVQELLKKAEGTKSKIIELRNAQKELRDSGQEASAQFIRNEVEIRRLSTSYNGYRNAIQAQVGANDQLTSSTNKINQVLSTQSVTIAEARAQNSEILKLRNNLNPAIAEEAAQLAQLNEKYQKNIDFIKDNSSAYEKQKMAIGDYKNQIKEALGELGPFDKALQSVGLSSDRVQIGYKTAQAALKDVKDSLGQAKQAQNEYKQAQDIATEATSKATAAQELAETIGFRYSQGLATQAEMEAATTAASEAHTVATEAQTIATNAGTVATIASSNAMKIFRAALISTGIGAIVVLLGSLVAYLTSTQEGIDKVTAITRPLKAIFQGLGTVFQNVGKFLYDAFANPKKTMNELYEFVKQNLINRFTAFGKILEGIMDLDFKKIADGAGQALTGVENLSGKLSNAAKATGKFLDDNIKRGQEIDKLNKQIEQAQINFERNQVKYNDAIDQQLLISKDTSKSFKEREAAAREIIRLNQVMGDEEAAIIQKRINLLNFERGARKATREEQQKLAELDTQLDAANDRGLESRIEQSKIISGLKKEQAEASKKAAEEAQKEVAAGIEAQKLLLDEYKLVQGERAKEVDERIAFNQKVYDDTVRIANAEYNNSKKTEADKTKLRIATAQAGLDLMKNNSEAVVKNAEQEYQRILSANKEFLKQGELLNDDKVDHEKERLQNIADAEVDRINTTIQNEQEAADAISKIHEELAIKKAGIDKTYEDQRRATQLADLDNQRAANADNFIVQQQIEAEQAEINKQRELAEAEDKGLNKAFIEDKYAEAARQRAQSLAEFEYEQRAQLLSGLKGLFGEQSRIGKLLAIAEIVNSTVQNSTKAFAQAAVYASNPLTLPLAVNARIQGGIIIATGAAQVAKTVGAKFRDGGLQMVGGNRHANGGTMFTGADGTQFEAEQGELIGVMNRNAARHFMAFNNAFPAGGSSSPGYYAGGGTLTAGATAPLKIDMDEMASKIAAATSEALRQSPPVVAVESITSAASRQAEIKYNALM